MPPNYRTLSECWKIKELALNKRVENRLSGIAVESEQQSVLLAAQSSVRSSEKKGLH